MEKRAHWENVYTTKPHDQVSWYREHLDNSLKLILGTGVAKHSAVIDVGGGSSTLVDDLIYHGFADITVLDISETAMAASKERLGVKAAEVEWIAADITQAKLPEKHYDVWHDRAVFHFLTDPEDRRRYVDLVKRSVKPGGHVIIATFGPGGPEKCSGLDIVRYDAASLHDEFGGSFGLVDSIAESHVTPLGAIQEFTYCYCRLEE